MKIVNLLGGLGNQMFEYAMYLALKDSHPDESIMFCTRSFHGYGLHNGLEIDRIFGVEIMESSLLQLCKLAYPFFNYRMWQVMLHFLPKRNSMTAGTTQTEFNFSDVTRMDSVFYDGYWQNEGYFKHIREDVIKAFAFPAFHDERNINLAEELSSHNSVSIHIRRGDYLKNPSWCVCDSDYYRKSIEYIKSKDLVNFLCVFSDDIPWCKENLRGMVGDMEIAYVDWNTGQQSYCDMQLMTYCKHNIIANSSFSWWGAWLGQREEKIVVAPRVWVNKPIINDPICESWIRI